MFRYSKTRFISRSTVILLAMIFLIVFLRSMPSDALPWLIALLALLAVFLFVYGITPMLTSHWVTRSRVILRQGLYFKCIIPMREILKAEPYDADMRIGLALSWRSSILFVTSSKYELIEIRLRRPRRFWQVLGFAAERIVFNVEKRDEMLSLLHERMTSLAPVKSYGPDS